MLTKNYLKLLSVNSVNRFCSKPYGLELLILLYDFTKNNDEYGIEETFEMIRYNRCKRPAFLSFVKDLEAEGIIFRLQSKVKKSRSLLRLNQDTIDEIDLVNGPDEL
jgi:hypothetical protein